jgi:predicted DNA-binding protein (MmcQ/YjbR family)
MDILELREFAISLLDTEESQPFGPNHLIFKTKGKMFLLLDLVSSPTTLNYKALPEDILSQREEFPYSIFPGWHMNKKHWNTMHLNRYLPQNKVLALIKASHSLIKK